MTTFHYIIIRVQNISNFMTIIGMVFNQMLILHDNTCKRIHKKCHQNTYHNDIKLYHTTLNTILTVAMFPKLSILM